MNLIYWLATATPSPAPFDKDDVTPGWVGFVAIFAIALITVLLVIDMTRRVRRVRYRSEVRERLEAEENFTAEGGPDSRDTP